jgi:LDH2 family malate/lactate/ureidoglycolate dehydrogenase
MPTYPASETERRVDAVALGQLVGAVFRHSGMRPKDAALLADTLVSADRRGVHSHGVLRVPEYVRKLAGGGVDPQGHPEVVRRVGACLVVDGGNSMGQIGAHFAMRRAIEVAGGSVGPLGVLPGRGSPPPPCGGATTAGRWPTTPCRPSRRT